MSAGAGLGEVAPPLKLVILARPDPIQIWTTNRVAALVEVLL